MSAVKEIQATDSFYSLREDQKQCQSLRSFEKCMTKDLLQKIKLNCGCIPYELMSNFDNSNVSIPFTCNKRF